MTTLPSGQWTVIAERPLSGHVWRWRTHWTWKGTQDCVQSGSIVTMHRHVGFDVHLVAQPMTRAWKKVLPWATYK